MKSFQDLPNFLPFECFVAHYKMVYLKKKIKLLHFIKVRIYFVQKSKKYIHITRAILVSCMSKLLSDVQGAITSHKSPLFTIISVSFKDFIFGATEQKVLKKSLFLVSKLSS